MKKPNDDPTEASIKATKDWYNSLTKQQQQLVFFDFTKYAKEHEILFPPKKVEDTKVTPTSTKTTASTKTTTINKPSTVSKVMAGTALVGDALNLFPPTSLLGYGIGLIPTTYDVVNDLKEGKYKEAATDALGYFPALKYIKKGINLKKGLDNLNSFYKFNTGIQMTNTIKDVKDAKEEFAYGGSTNRFMQPSQYYEPTQGFKLDYNQLAAGVLAREDAYDQNAAKIDAMDQDYIQGITGIESDKAKEINSNISTMVNTIGDQYNGDLSKAGDAVRNAKKYIKQTTGFDSEGALINANLKAYIKNLKDIDKQKHWSEKEKIIAKNKALADHNALTTNNKASAGEFSSYSNFNLNDHANLQQIANEYMGTMEPSQIESLYGLTVATGPGGVPMTDVDGNPQYYKSGSVTKTILTPTQIAQAVGPAMMNDPRVMNYLESASQLNTFTQNLQDPDRFNRTNAENQLKSQELLLLQQDTSVAGIEKLQDFLGVDVDGVIGTDTKAALDYAIKYYNNIVDEDTETADYYRSKIGTSANISGNLGKQNKLSQTQQFHANKAWENAAAGRAEELKNSYSTAGQIGGEGYSPDFAKIQEAITNIEGSLKQQLPKVASMLHDIGFRTTNSKGEVDEVMVFNQIEKMVRMSDEETVTKYRQYPEQTISEIKQTSKYKNDMEAANTYRNGYITKIQAQGRVKKKLDNTEGIKQAFASDAINNNAISSPHNSYFTNFVNENQNKLSSLLEEVMAGGGTSKDFVTIVLKNMESLSGLASVKSKITEKGQGGLAYRSSLEGLFLISKENSAKLNPSLGNKDYIQELKGVIYTSTDQFGKANENQSTLEKTWKSFKGLNINNESSSFAEELEKRELKESDIIGEGMTSVELGVPIMTWRVKDGSTFELRNSDNAPMVKAFSLHALKNPRLKGTAAEATHKQMVFSLDAPSYISNENAKNIMNETGRYEYSYLDNRIVYVPVKGSTTGEFEVKIAIGGEEKPYTFKTENGTFQLGTFTDIELVKQTLVDITY